MREIREVERIGGEGMKNEDIEENRQRQKIEVKMPQDIALM